MMKVGCGKVSPMCGPEEDEVVSIQGENQERGLLIKYPDQVFHYVIFITFNFH